MGAVAKAEGAQWEPSLAGDAAAGASDEDESELETKGELGASEIEEPEDPFASGSEDDGGGRGTQGKGAAPADMAA